MCEYANLQCERSNKKYGGGSGGGSGAGGGSSRRRGRFVKGEALTLDL